MKRCVQWNVVYGAVVSFVINLTGKATLLRGVVVEWLEQLNYDAESRRKA